MMAGAACHRPGQNEGYYGGGGSMMKVKGNGSARRALPVLAAVMMLLGGARATWAHQDPGTCNHPGVAIEFFVFRADGTTVISATDTVSPCETIVYQVRLRKQSDPTVCAFEAGKIFITTPDSV